VWVLAPNIAEVLIGESFRGAAVTVIPIITLGAFLSGIKAFYFDLSFHLGQSTIGQVWVSLIATLVNILLNLLFIPKFGLPGAAFATVLAYIVGLFLSIVWGRKIFPLPVPTKTLFKIVVATAGMAVALVPLRSHMGGGALAFQILAGCVIFVILAWKLEILKDFREHQPTKRFCQSVLPNE
jgi:O-antigen/teichoic acid export membrane protein